MTQLRVCVRVRPDTSGTSIVHTQLKRLVLQDPEGKHSGEYVFERTFATDQNQSQVFSETTAPLVAHVLAGYHACCLMFGASGSGKSYTLCGIESADGEQRGIIQRSAELAFKDAEQLVRSGAVVKVSIFVSMIDISGEQVRRMLDAVILAVAQQLNN